MKNYRDPLPRGPPLRLSAPSVNSFYIEWEEELRSDWNQAALAIIVNHVMASYPDVVAASDRPFVRNAAITYLQHLMSEYHANLDPRHRAAREATQKISTMKRDVSAVQHFLILRAKF